jgi:hypothetical protein
MRVNEVFSVSYDAKKADDYTEIDLLRLIQRCDAVKAARKLELREAAAEIIQDEIKDRNLVPSMEEGVKLIKHLLLLKNDLTPKTNKEEPNV